MKRLAFLLILVSVTASLTGCRRGFPLLGLRGNGNQCGPTCGTPAPAGMFGGAFQAAPTACEYAPPAVSAPAYSAPMMMTAPGGPGCDCGANAAPMGNPYVVGSNPNTVPGMTSIEGMGGYMGNNAIQGMPASTMSMMPMDGMPNQMIQGQTPMNAGFGMNVIGDRVLGQGEMIAPDNGVKVGQK